MVDKDNVWEALKGAVCPQCGSKDISANVVNDDYVFECDDCDHQFKAEVE